MKTVFPFNHQTNGPWHKYGTSYLSTLIVNNAHDLLIPDAVLKAGRFYAPH